jgi:hypothetical protein
MSHIIRRDLGEHGGGRHRQHADRDARRPGYIGRSQCPDPYLKGEVDDFRVHGRTLTPAEVAALAQG